MSYNNHSHNFRGRQYRPVQTVKIEERREGMAGTYWRVLVDGKLYHCANEQGKMVRIAFKPRGQNRGFHWYGSVRDDAGKNIYSERVNKSTGPLAMLHDAGVITWQFEQEGT